MNTSGLVALILIAVAYFCGLAAMVFWIAQVAGMDLGPLTALAFRRYGWSFAILLLLAYLMFGRNADEAWIRSQFLWLSRSFVGLLVAGMAGGLCLLLGAWLEIEAFAFVAFGFWVAGGLWFLYHWARGLWCLLRRVPVGP